MGLEKQVTFGGLCDDVFPRLSRADVFLLPSKWEGIPMTVIEAMGTGLPVIASRVGGLPDMIEDGKEGLLIRPTPQALAEALSKLLASEDLRQALGTAAVEAAQRFSVQTMARKYEALYEERA